MEKQAAFLHIVRGEDKGKGWELTPDLIYTIGRSRQCTFRLNDDAVSAQHARIEFQNEAWQITDLASTHGTYVNKQRILAPKPLFDRDRIRVGRTRFEFREYQHLDGLDLAEIDRGVELPE